MKRIFYFNCLAIHMVLIALCASKIAYAENIHVAVAANFTATMKELIKEFEKMHPNSITASYASSGQIYAQIVNGAPYDIFFSADTERPQKLIVNGYANAENSFVYAEGVLILWQETTGEVVNERTLKDFDINGRIAIANPKHAPYGKAAIETLQRISVYEHWKRNLITAQNVAQVHQFVDTGSSPFGFIAYSQVKSLPLAKQGSYWIVPEEFYSPIEQQLVLLNKAEKNPTAHAFLNFVKSSRGENITKATGYNIPAS